MAVFQYKGLTHEGKDINGIIDADTSKVARSKLRKSGIFAVEVTPGSESGTARVPATGVADRISLFLKRERVPLKELAIATRQLATLLGAGFTLLESLNALIEHLETKDLKMVMAAVRERIREGTSFADALRGHPRIFQDLYCNMVKAGETSGTLDVILQRLADFLEGQLKLKNKVVSAMAYPIFMLIIGTAILSGLIIFVIPKVTEVFSEMHQVLPLPTIILIGISNLLKSYWWILAAFAITGTYLTRLYIDTEAGRRWYDKLLLKLPVAGKLIRMLAVSRFARTLSTLLSSGIPLLQSLDIVKNLVANKVLESAIDSARKNIREGEGIAEPLRRSGVFPSLVVHMISLGEKSGELEGMLLKISDTYDNEVDTTISSLTSLLAPVMILVMGLIVLFIVLAILQPIFNLSQIVR
ncbi:MAG TPA: type II secretion system inner membrane protein GspF [Nitrospiria bacterium]|nr:type II secretion system inner membrane protein GspF [Nitrospiria bacterium]